MARKKSIWNRIKTIEKDTFKIIKKILLGLGSIILIAWVWYGIAWMRENSMVSNKVGFIIASVLLVILFLTGFVSKSMVIGKLKKL